MDSELAELQSTYPDQYEDYINRLSAYMASSGKHYANHYATIRKWLDEDRKPKSGKSYDYTETYEERRMLVNANPIMAAIVEAADTLNNSPDDYINPDDGLKYCGRCHNAQRSLFPRTVPQKTGWTSIRLPVNARLRNGRGVKQNSGSWSG